MGGLGSGVWKKRRRKTVEACPLIDVNYLSARGCLQPGWSGTCQGVLYNEVISIDLRAEADQLHLSWHLAGEGNCGLRLSRSPACLVISAAAAPISSALEMALLAVGGG
jgi:hypothetical protein